jgi:probable rRNA maturation factor
VSVEVTNESGIDVDVEALLALARYVLDELTIHPQAELSVVLMDEDAMTVLHERWMDEPGPTDVMAFPMDELRSPRDDAEPEPGLLGDVVICPQVAQRQAQAARHAFADELDLLCTHGILHLLGHDHYDPDEQRVMFALQARLLAGWQGARAGGSS